MQTRKGARARYQRAPSRARVPMCMQQAWRSRSQPNVVESTKHRDQDRTAMWRRGNPQRHRDRNPLRFEERKARASRELVSASAALREAN